VYVALTLRLDLFQLEHEVGRAVHPGVIRMYASILHHSDWEAMAADVPDWVDSIAS